MNYALDALWWRLDSPPVRDLAALLTAPPLWDSGVEWPVRALLGRSGLRFLLSLNDDPAPLTAYLAAHAPFGGRLGVYAERLLAFWLDNAPHCRLLAHNLPVEENGRRLGALDFVAEADGRCLHIELACKYYGAESGRAADLVGLNAADRLADKAAKLHKQLALSRQPAGLRALAAAGLRVDAAVSVVRGMGFSAAGVSGAPLCPTGWHGGYRRTDSPTLLPHGRYYVLPRMALLAPARVGEAELADAETAARAGPAILAKVARRSDGLWHETERIMQVEAV
ncbi:DUF1853 family protein [Neisseria leonii]|uniref:DUF1853 family protein n=1 Tax=Neisseria leonii TaxID=2995413 RepID=UPI00237B7396|nr:DUF1853 family protein [Neisseria sp. 3986]MDD9324796.1 DUF1853 family protein [Neisseria sp. 3986]